MPFPANQNVHILPVPYIFPIMQFALAAICNNYHCLTHPQAECSTAWWRHQMETFSALLALCAREFTGPGEFPTQRPVTRSFDVFFHLRLNKRLSKQPRGWWFETPPWSLWRQCNGSSWRLFCGATGCHDDNPGASKVLSNVWYIYIHGAYGWGRWRWAIDCGHGLSLLRPPRVRLGSPIAQH